MLGLGALAREWNPRPEVPGGEVFEMMQMEIQHECILYFYFFLFTSFLFVILCLFSSISQSIRKSFSHYSVGPVVPQSVMSVM